MHVNVTYKNSWNRKQNKVCVTVNSELYRRKPVLTYAIAVVGGFGEFGEHLVESETGFVTTIVISDCLHKYIYICHHSSP